MIIRQIISIFQDQKDERNTYMYMCVHEFSLNL